MNSAYKIQHACDRFTGYKQMRQWAAVALPIISCTDGIIRINRSVCRCANCIVRQRLIRYSHGGNKYILLQKLCIDCLIKQLNMYSRAHMHKHVFLS